MPEQANINLALNPWVSFPDIRTGKIPLREWKTLALLSGLRGREKSVCHLKSNRFWWYANNKNVNFSKD